MRAALSVLILLVSTPALAQVELLGSQPEATTLPAGEFAISWEPDAGGRLVVRHQAAPERELWATLPGEAFVSAGRAEARWKGERGSFGYRGDDAQAWTQAQDVREVVADRDGVEVRGVLALVGGAGLTQALGVVRAHTQKISWVAYSLRFEARDDVQLAFSLRFTPEAGLNRSSIRYASEADERFLGFGTQFSHLDLKGRRVPVLTREQGIGRGLQPLTFLLNRAGGAGGDWSTSYAAVPHYLTSQMRSLFLTSSEPSVFDLTRRDAVEVNLHGPRLDGRILYGDSPLALIEGYTRYAGRMRPLPDWIHRGAVIGVMGGEDALREKLAQLESHAVPVSGLFVQDWVGRRETRFGTRLWWNWESDPSTYPDWTGLVAELRERGIRVLSYVNPWLVSRPGASRDLFEEAREAGYLVRDADGEVHEEDNGGFAAALIDLSNPATRDWFKGVIKDQLLSTGVSGWMGDFGEALPFDAQIASGDAHAFHNRYPEVWAQVQREAIAEAGLQDEVVAFSRSAFTRSPGIARMFWLGDQLPSWDRHDGIRSALTGLLSSGVSGFSLQHSDTGGYTTIKLGKFKSYRRTQQLLMRWTELSAFTAVLRTHEGLAPEANHQVWSSPETLDHFARATRLFQALFPYRKRLMAEAAQKGWPLARHPWLQYPQHLELLAVRDQFMLGADLVVAPVLRCKAERVEATLPPGRWVHLWSGDVHGEPAEVSQVRLDAPLGEPAVLYREGSTVGEELQQVLGD